MTVRSSLRSRIGAQKPLYAYVSYFRALHACGIAHQKQKQVGQFYFGRVGQISIGTDSIVREAYFNRPAEERDAWLKWLGL